MISDPQYLEIKTFLYEALASTRSIGRVIDVNKWVTGMSNVRSLKNVSFDFIFLLENIFWGFFYKMTAFFVISLNVLFNPLIKTTFYWENINVTQQPTRNSEISK